MSATFSRPDTIDLSDPGSAEVVTVEDFESLMIDRREQHSPLVRGTSGRMITYTPVKRSWSQVRGITLHQTACDMGERVERYDTMGAHFGILRSGRIIRLADANRVVYHGNGWNKQCVGIEVNGLYAGREDDPATLPDEALRTTWNDPSTAIRETPQQVTEASMVSLRMLIRWICYDTLRNGGGITVLNAHRQASMDRRNDPGEAIWKMGAIPMHFELGLTDGGVGFKIGGYAIPECWDARCYGVSY